VLEHTTPHRATAMAMRHPGKFTDDFLAWLPANLHVYDAFEREAQRVYVRGFKHYSARTIVHVLRHHSALAEVGDGWKLNNNHSPYLARLFDLLNPAMAGLWEYRATKAVALKVAA
jgi:hypothetical protein